ncbi:hypothetical protein [Pedobacter sp. SYP-B3415]|uniref:hypothetical protein n=1 Tax=Pedobacter sp. SYP-B3415 TaxID=2496641 RepID=UPI00101C32BE|nr:hypothetical protein [Pedobacter sp. SYP-B3415]
MSEVPGHVAFWEQFFEHLAAGKHKAADWQMPFYNTRFADGEEFGDGNPIYSVKNLKTGKFVKIVQEHPAPGERLLSHWEEKHEKDELVVVCGTDAADMERAQ